MVSGHDCRYRAGLISQIGLDLLDVSFVKYIDRVRCYVLACDARVTHNRDPGAHFLLDARPFV